MNKLFKIRVAFNSKVTGKEIVQHHKVVSISKTKAYSKVLDSFKESSVNRISCMV